MMLAAVMELIDTTIVNIALPSIRSDLQAGGDALEWIVAAYALVFGVGLITGGRLGDVFGRRRVFLVGVVGFTAASALSGAAQSPGMLVAARVCQGLFAAVMVPQVLATIQALFPPEERAKAYGMYGAFAGLSIALGPLVGGVVLQGNLFGLHWRPIFLINVPIGVIALIAAAAMVKESRDEHPPKLDLVGTALVTGALLLLMFPLIEGRHDGWPVWFFLLMAASVPALAVFALQQRERVRARLAPLVELTLFKQRAFTGGVLGNLTFFANVGGAFLVLTITLQAGLHYSPLHTALTYAPWSLGLIATAATTSELSPRLGRWLTVIGALVTTLGIVGILVAVDVAGSSLSSWALIPGLLLGGAGMGMVAPSLADVALGGVDREHAGSASGVFNTANEVGTAIGVAVLGVLFFGVLPGNGFLPALRDTLWLEIGISLLSALSMFLLPRRGAPPLAEFGDPELEQLAEPTAVSAA
jgi:EmrB/QacA subfamily drug resistance transporter